MIKYYKSLSERIKTTDYPFKYDVTLVMMLWWQQKLKTKYLFPIKKDSFHKISLLNIRELLMNWKILTH